MFSFVYDRVCFKKQQVIKKMGYYIDRLLFCDCCVSVCLCMIHPRFGFSIEGEYVPVEGDEVTYKVSRVPPKNLKVQAVEVKITHLNPGTKHETWSGQIISS